MFYPLFRRRQRKSQVCTVIRRKTLPFLGNSARIAPAHNNLIADGSLWKTLCESLLVSRKTFCVFHIFRRPYYHQDSRSKRRVRLYPRRQLLVGTKSKASREEKKLAQRLDLFAFHLAPRFDRTTLFRGLTGSHSVTMAIIITAIRLRLTLRRGSGHIFSPKKTLCRSLSTQVNKRTKSSLIDFLALSPNKQRQPTHR